MFLCMPSKNYHYSNHDTFIIHFVLLIFYNEMCSIFQNLHYYPHDRGLPVWFVCPCYVMWSGDWIRTESIVASNYYYYNIFVINCIKARCNNIDFLVGYKWCHVAWKIILQVSSFFNGVPPVLGSLRWLPTVLTVCTLEGGWRTKNELLVSPLGLSSWHSQWRLVTHLGFLFN